MRVIVAGSRSITSFGLVERAILRSGFPVTEIVSGCAAGVDRLGERWAKERGFPVKRFPADWQQFGKRAGYLRNAQMAGYSDALVSVWDGKSRGSALMIGLAREAGLRCFVTTVR